LWELTVLYRGGTSPLGVVPLQNDQSRVVELLALVASPGKLKPVFAPSSLVKPSPDIIAQSTNVLNMAVLLCRKNKGANK
jgi:hypothetical protein